AFLRCGDPAAGDPRRGAVGRAGAVRQPAAAAAWRGRDLVELPGQRLRFDGAVDRLLPLGTLAGGHHAPGRSRHGGDPFGNPGADTGSGRRPGRPHRRRPRWGTRRRTAALRRAVRTAKAFTAWRATA